jgi:uncharacterized protein (TIGR02594 family)
MDVLKLQRALTAQGYDPGMLDGIWGRATREAVLDFQTRHGLAADGVVTPALETQILSAAAPAASNGMVWLDEARRLMGTKEVAGRGSNRVILDFATDLGIPYSGDDIPWCGLFVAHCIGATLPSEKLPANPLGARNWGKFGKRLNEAVEGAVLVFWRGSKTGWLGHVGFYVCEDKDAYHVLGGNQSDEVSIARVLKNRLLSAQWPASATAIEGKKIMCSATGEVSTRES